MVLVIEPGATIVVAVAAPGQTQPDAGIDPHDGRPDHDVAAG